MEPCSLASLSSPCSASASGSRRAPLPRAPANGRRGDQRGSGRVEQRDSGKVALCHRGKTIRVDGNAVRAHLNHGDRRGRCR